MFSRLKQKVIEESLNVNTSANRYGSSSSLNREEHTLSNSLKLLEEKVNEDITKSISSLEKGDSVDKSEVFFSQNQETGVHRNSLISMKQEQNSFEAPRDSESIETSLQTYLSLNQTLEKDKRSLNVSVSIRCFETNNLIK